MRRARAIPAPSHQRGEFAKALSDFRHPSADVRRLEIVKQPAEIFNLRGRLHNSTSDSVLTLLLACTSHSLPGPDAHREPADTGAGTSDTADSNDTADTDTDTDSDSTLPDEKPCTAPANHRTKPTPAESAAAAASNELGLELLRLQDKENPFLAPLNISTALGMLYAGTGTTTADEMATLLGDTTRDGSVHTALAGLNAALETASGDPTVECPTWTFSSANNAFVDVRLDLKPGYLTTLATPYGVIPLVVDYWHDPAGAADTINDWVSTETKGHITDIVAEEQFTYDNLLTLGSAVYFAGSWVTPFIHQDTADLPFHLVDGSTSTVSMMRGDSYLRPLTLDHAVAVELPYRGDDVSFVIVVPNDVDGVENVLASLSPADISPAAFDAADTIETILQMPRFEIDATLALAKSLADAGMPTAFDEYFADLSPTADPPPDFSNLYVSAVVHKSWIKVDEAGTEAAAATVIEESGTDSAADLVIVTADHPFLYFIHDRVTGAILFAGRFDKPPE